MQESMLQTNLSCRWATSRSTSGCWLFVLDRNYISQVVVWREMKYYKKYDCGKRKSKGAQSPQTEIWPRRKKLLQVTTFCCCTIFHLCECWERFRLLWAGLLSLLGCRADGNHENSWSRCRRTAVSVLRQERGLTSDAEPVNGTRTAAYSAEDSTLSRRSLRKNWSVTSGEKRWCGQFESCSRWRIQTSVRTELLSVWLTGRLPFISRDS